MNFETLVIRARLMVAGQSDWLGNTISASTIKNSIESFKGKPLVAFTHDYSAPVKIEDTRGEVIDVEWVESKQAADAIIAVDRIRFPAYCRAIEDGYLGGAEFAGKSIHGAGDELERIDVALVELGSATLHKNNVVAGEAPAIAAGPLVPAPELDRWDFL